MSLALISTFNLQPYSPVNANVLDFSLVMRQAETPRTRLLEAFLTSGAHLHQKSNWVEWSVRC